MKSILLLFALCSSVYAVTFGEGIINLGRQGHQLRAVQNGVLEFSNDGTLYKSLGASPTISPEGGLNIFIDGFFENGISSWVTSGGSFSLQEYTNGFISNKRYGSFSSTASGEYVESPCLAVPSFFSSDDIVSHLRYVTTSSGFEVRTYNCESGDILISTTALSSSSTWKKSDVSTFSKPNNVKIRIISTNALAGSIDIDDAYIGINNTSGSAIQLKVDTFIPVNIHTQSCRIENSSGTPVVDNSSGLCNWILSTSPTGTGEISINIEPGVFTSDPVCQCTSSLQSDDCRLLVKETSSLVRVQTTNPGGSALSSSFNISCEGAR